MTDPEPTNEESATVNGSPKPPRPPQHIDELTPYQPGRSIEEIREQTGLDTIHKMASNENPLGSSPKAMARAKNELKRVNVYPRAGLALRGALAERLDVPREQVVAGAGSEGVLLHAMRTFLQPGDEVLTAEGTFIGFYVLAAAMNLKLRTVPLNPETYSYDLEALARELTPQTRLVYIANPNNPTATIVTKSGMKTFLEKVPDEVLVIVDEAYYEYARDLRDDYPDTIADPHPQVLTLRTFSKVYGLAGMRIGYGVGDASVIEAILKVKLPFEPSAVSEAAALGALEDESFLQQSLKSNREGRRTLHKALEELGLGHTDSAANFTLVPLESPERAQWLSEELLKRGIIARPMVPFRLPHAVRITFGDEEQTRALIGALEEIFGE
jgi:histidinol-phosphate aminotransferase